MLAILPTLFNRYKNVTQSFSYHKSRIFMSYQYKRALSLYKCMFPTYYRQRLLANTEVSLSTKAPVISGCLLIFEGYFLLIFAEFDYTAVLSLDPARIILPFQLQLMPLVAYVA